MVIIDDIILLVISIALSIALAPKPPKPKAATISDFQLPTAEEGRPIPVVFGTVDITGGNVLWYGNLFSEEIQHHSMFSSVTLGHHYFLAFHLGLCHGPVDAITRVSWGDKLAWKGNITASGSGGINQGSLFGGDRSEGGVAGAFDVIMGSVTEPVNSYLNSILGAVPAYRGITSFVWKSVQNSPWGPTQVSYNPDGTTSSVAFGAPNTIRSGYLGTTPYIKPIAVRCVRTISGWSNTPWYTAKAAVSSTSAYTSAPSWTSSWDSTLNGTINNSQTTIGYPAADPHFNTNTLGFLLIGTEWMQVTAVDTVGHLLTVVRHAFGTSAATHNDGDPFSFWQADTAPTISMNAAHIVYECLTNIKWGMGLSALAMNDAGFRAAADLFYTEGMGLSMIWVQASTVGDFLQIVLNHCNANLVFDPASGLYNLIPIRGGYSTGGLPVFDETNISKLDDLQMPGYADQPNEVTVVYCDPATGKDTAITAQNIAGTDIQGKTVPITVGLQGIRSHALARNVLGRELSSRTTPLVRAKFTTNRKAWSTTNGGVFKFSWADRGISNMVMRVAQISKGTLQNNDVVVDCVQDIFALGLADYVVNTVVSPTAVPTGGAVTTSPPTSTGSAVISSTVSSPPGSPANLDTYLVPAGATGAWAGHAGQMARWDATLRTWVFITIPPGTIIYDTAGAGYVTSTGSAIVPASLLGTLDVPTHLQIRIFGE